MSGCTPYPYATAEKHPCVARLRSHDGGMTWTKPEDVSTQFWGKTGESILAAADSSVIPYGGFFGSGRIVQSRLVKKGKYYRLYAAMLLGEQYAENLGFNIRRLRIVLLIITGLLTAVVTAFCGPIAFIGLATPHIARLIIGTENHRRLLPVTMLMGASIALLCNLFCTLPSDGGIIPLNAVTPLFGAPVIIYVLVKRR